MLSPVEYEMTAHWSRRASTFLGALQQYAPPAPKAILNAL